MRRSHMKAALLLVLSACGGSSAGGGGDPCRGVACSDHSACIASGSSGICTCDPSYVRSGSSCVPSVVPTVGGCKILPSDHIFNTPIEDLPPHPSSATFMATIGSHPLHLDLGQSTDMTSSEYWGIPYNVVHGDSLTWKSVRYYSADPDMTWNPRSESDCAVAGGGGVHTTVSPCTSASAPSPVLPVPDSPLVEGGIATDTAVYGDHHLLALDTDTCRLWELYHVYRNGSGWDIFGSALFDLSSNALRPATWTSADAAGFPILPLLLRADEASSGVIRHALRFTIPSGQIRGEYVWPARHVANDDTSPSLPPMGQLFRLQKTYQIPSTFHVQSRAILQALKTYGMYIADGGSAMYIQGEPSGAWADEVFSEVQSVNSSQFEAVDLLRSMQQRAGFDPDSAAVPPP